MPLVTATRDKVKNRLIVTAGAAADPSDPVVEEMVRDAYTELLGEFKLPRLVEASVTANDETERYEAEIAGVALHFAGMHQKLLVPSLEYAWTDDTLHLAPGVAITDDPVWAWVTPVIDVTGATITTDCVHGPEWLEPACVWRAAMLVLSRMSRGSGSTGAAMHGPHYRALEPGYLELLKAMKAKQEDWFATQREALSMRLTLGDHPTFEAPYAQIRERGGRKRNRLLGI